MSQSKPMRGSADQIRIIYSRHYDIGFFGLERLHPFDSRKYSRAWKCLKRTFGGRLKQWTQSPGRPVSRNELLRVHTAEYLDSLRRSSCVAQALELPIVGKLPGVAVDAWVLRPLRWGTKGTMIAPNSAVQCGLAVNLSGGYHHAKPNQGEGFCIYADVALAIDELRRSGALAEDARVAHIDLDAHMGNGVCHMFRHDSRVFLFDMYNHTIYPSYDHVAQNRIDCAIGVHGGWTSREYVDTLRARLPGFLDSITSSQPVALAVYHAGTDVYEHDALGCLNVTAEDVLRRDLFVIEQLRSRNIPALMVLSGGYSRESYRLVFRTVQALVESWKNHAK